MRMCRNNVSSAFETRVYVRSNMEKFLSGYTGPPAKKPKSDSHTKAKKKADSDKPLEVRKFCESWRWDGGKKRDWLEYHPQTKTMRCEYV